MFDERPRKVELEPFRSFDPIFRPVLMFELRHSVLFPSGSTLALLSLFFPFSFFKQAEIGPGRLMEWNEMEGDTRGRSSLSRENWKMKKKGFSCVYVCI